MLVASPPMEKEPGHGAVAADPGVWYDPPMAKRAAIDDLINDERIPEDLREALRSRVVKEIDEAALYRAILETSVDGIVTIDDSGRIESFNPAAERIFGYTKEDTVGRNVSMLMPPPDREHHDKYLETFKRTREPRVIGIGREVQARRKDGSTFPMQLAISEVRLRDRQIFAGIVHDLTLRKRAEKTLVSINEQVRRDVGQELHDALGQQLTGLNLLAKSLTGKLEGNASALQGQAQDLVDLSRSAVEQVRALSRGLYPVTLTRDGLESALRDLTATINADSGTECSFKRDGPSEELPTEVALHLYRIAQEAVTNALKYAEASRVEVLMNVAPYSITVAVSDDGVGFDLNTSTADGLGLMIMRYRADLIGATLTVTSAAGTGCRIETVMPRTILEWYEAST